MVGLDKYQIMKVVEGVEDHWVEHPLMEVDQVVQNRREVLVVQVDHPLVEVVQVDRPLVVVVQEAFLQVLVVQVAFLQVLVVQVVQNRREVLVVQVAFLLVEVAFLLVEVVQVDHPLVEVVVLVAEEVFNLNSTSLFMEVN